MSTKQFGCFFCVGTANRADALCSQCSKPVDVSSALKGASLGSYLATGILGRGFYGWTVEGQQGYQRFSIKIVPIHRLDRSSLADKEVKALVACSPHPNIAQFIQQVPVTLNVDGVDVQVLCLVFEYIPNARPLREIIADDTLVLSRSDVVSILAGIASGLARTNSENLDVRILI